MHIAINAHLLAHTRSFRRAGVSNYVEALLTHLGMVDQRNRYTIYTTRGLDGAALRLPPNFTIRAFASLGSNCWRRSCCGWRARTCFMACSTSLRWPARRPA